MDCDNIVDEKLLLHRKSLPIFPYRDHFLQIISKHQVLVIAGQPCSGKSTQIPQYLHEAGYTNIVCTQPWRVAVMTLATRVSQEMGVTLGQEVCYVTSSQRRYRENSCIKFMTANMLLCDIIVKRLDLARHVVILDEAHERNCATDILLGVFKNKMKRWPGIKLIVSSANMGDAQKFSNYFDCAPILNINKRQFPIEIQHLKESPQGNYLDVALTAALQLHMTESLGGDILVFLTCPKEIEVAQAALIDYARGLREIGVAEVIVCPVYAGLEAELQDKIFEPAPEGARKVFLATNVAETTLTIEGIKYVIDPGLCQMTFYDPLKRPESMQVSRISKASANYRAAKVGQVGPGGRCLRLYTAYNYDNDLEDISVPHIRRTNPAFIVLIAGCLGIHSFFEFDTKDLQAARASLIASGMLDKQGKLTFEGRRLVNPPINTGVSEMSDALERFNL